MSRVYEDVPEGIRRAEIFNIGNVAIPGVDTIDLRRLSGAVSSTSGPWTNVAVRVVQRGIKGGNWSLIRSAALRMRILSTGEEVLDAYEKTAQDQIFSGGARLDAAAYYYDYQDYQALDRRADAAGHESGRRAHMAAKSS